MGEHERERQHKFTLPSLPRKLRKPLSPETKRALKKFGGWVLCLAVGGAIVFAIYWSADLALMLPGRLGRLISWGAIAIGWLGRSVGL